MSSNEKANQIARLQEQLRIIVAERQRLELEIKETDRVKTEIRALPPETDLYKSTGPVLYKSNMEEISSGLDKYRNELSERLTVYQSQESSLRTEVERLRRAASTPQRLSPNPESESDSEEDS